MTQTLTRIADEILAATPPAEARRLADLIERAVIEDADDPMLWVEIRLGLARPEDAADMRAHPEVYAFFLAEMKQLAARLRAEAPQAH